MAQPDFAGASPISGGFINCGAYPLVDNSGIMERRIHPSSRGAPQLPVFLISYVSNLLSLRLQNPRRTRYLSDLRRSRAQSYEVCAMQPLSAPRARRSHCLPPLRARAETLAGR